MKIILVTHPSRIAHVEQLQRHLPVLTTIVDTVSARSGHAAALAIASQHEERVVIMEDDAIPVQDFDALSDFWGKAHPDDLISFYLGTGRPRQYQALVDGRVAHARSYGDTALWMPTLIHAVCYSVPTGRAGDVLERMRTLPSIREADFAVGAAWGQRVLYPLESLVQHRDGPPVERHPDGDLTRGVRVARQLAGPLMFN